MNDRLRRATIAALTVAALATGCAKAPPPNTAADLARMPWDSIVTRARGTTVVWRMWRGDPSINAFVDKWVAPRVLSAYGVTLQAVSGQGNELVDQLSVEKESGTKTGTASLL